MRRPVLGTLLALACVSILFLPASASAIPIHVHKTVEVIAGVEVEEVDVYHVAPKDTDEDGYKDSVDNCPSEPYSTNGGCEPAPPPVAEPVSEYIAPAAEPAVTEASYSSGGYSIPSDIVMCESGGDYGAVNPSSGAYGAYQILPSTSAAYGCDMSSAAGQDACAAEIYADSGRSAWVC